VLWNYFDGNQNLDAVTDRKASSAEIQLRFCMQHVWIQNHSLCFRNLRALYQLQKMDLCFCLVVKKDDMTDAGIYRMGPDVGVGVSNV